MIFVCLQCRCLLYNVSYAQQIFAKLSRFFSSIFAKTDGFQNLIFHNSTSKMEDFAKIVDSFQPLKVVSAFLSNLYSSPNDSPSKFMNNAFYLIQKALFVLEIFKFLNFCLPIFFSRSAIA